VRKERTFRKKKMEKGHDNLAGRLKGYDKGVTRKCLISLGDERTERSREKPNRIFKGEIKNGSEKTNLLNKLGRLRKGKIVRSTQKRVGKKRRRILVARVVSQAKYLRPERDNLGRRNVNRL